MHFEETVGLSRGRLCLLDGQLSMKRPMSLPSWAVMMGRYEDGGEERVELWQSRQPGSQRPIFRRKKVEEWAQM